MNGDNEAILKCFPSGLSPNPEVPKEGINYF
jgi:hypothetical protein